MKFPINLEMTDFSNLSNDMISFSNENDLEIDKAFFPISYIENPFFKHFLFDNDNQEKGFLFIEKVEEKEKISLPKVLNNIEKSISKKNIRKKGRRKKGKNQNYNEQLSQHRNRFHNKNETDNILRKIQVHYLSFIESYLNDILEKFGYEERFQRLDYKFKKDIKKKCVNSLKEKTIGDIISNKISIKYKYKKEDFNEKLCDKLKKENKVLNNILSQNYLLPFQKVYYKNINEINLKDFGLDYDKYIFLSDKVKMYKDLLFKNKESFLYFKKINKCIKEHFYPKLIFALKYY